MATTQAQVAQVHTASHDVDDTRHRSSVATYRFQAGLRELAATLEGTERISIGIRPYELHAGNVLAIGAYPYLLCEYFQEATGRPPAFTLVLTLNDWEQASMGGPDIYRYQFDVYPVGSTIAHLRVGDVSSVEYWEPRIAAEIGKIREAFPGVALEVVRVSDLQQHPEMRAVIEHAIRHRAEHKDLLLEASGIATLGQDMQFAAACCTTCLSANVRSTWRAVGDAAFIDGECVECGAVQTVPYEDASMWLYHKQIFVARWRILQTQVAFSGCDHLNEGDDRSRPALYELLFGEPAPPLQMAFAPMVQRNDGIKMSKSRSNTLYRSLEQMVDHARACGGSVIRLEE